MPRPNTAIRPDGEGSGVGFGKAGAGVPVTPRGGCGGLGMGGGAQRGACRRAPQTRHRKVCIGQLAFPLRVYKPPVCRETRWLASPEPPADQRMRRWSESSMSFPRDLYQAFPLLLTHKLVELALVAVRELLGEAALNHSAAERAGQ